MTYLYLCRHFYSATNIPITLTKNGVAVYSSYNDIVSSTPNYIREMFPLEQNPCFCGDIPDTIFGRVHIEGSDYDLFLGPVFSIPMDTDHLYQIKKHLSMSQETSETFLDFLRSIPLLTQHQFAHYLVLLHRAVNGQEVEIETLFQENEIQTSNRREQQLENRISDLEEENFHNSYYFELELYQHIKNGDVEKLKRFLASSHVPLREGRMAASPLRHAKNIFIGFVTKVGTMAAIPGGLDVEKTYQLIDYYICECEQLDRIEYIDKLQYSMILDFCQRCREAHIPAGISSEVYRCMMYIRNHTNEPISIESACAHVNRSASYMMKHFKTELGMGMGAYITQCKLEEAQSLLAYSDKSLAEISNYLCFSSQPYFQNVFKKQYGLTPLAYRKQSQSGKV
jgi:AraC-like DNA-binding protein